ncbi:MAG: LysR family transcriptional regulator [Pseudomonadota bacterium]
MVQFTLKQCRYFIAVAENGGIAQASRALNITQPAVAQAIGNLEAHYGLRLFSRHHSRGAELTPEGRSFYRLAMLLMENAGRVDNQAKAIADHLAGYLRFGCFHTVAPFFLAQLINSFGEECPGIEVRPAELTQDQIMAGLVSGELDLALTYDMGLNQKELDWISLRRLNPSVLLCAAHPLASEQSVSLKEFEAEPFVMFDGPFSREYFESVLLAGKINPPVSYNARSMEAVRCAVGNGLGFSLSVMKPVHAKTYDGGMVTTVPITDQVDPIELGLASRKSAEPSSLLSRFKEFCVSELQHCR